jgi:hypothetical protein
MKFWDRIDFVNSFLGNFVKMFIVISFWVITSIIILSCVIFTIQLFAQHNFVMGGITGIAGIVSCSLSYAIWQKIVFLFF